ncbi:MAG: FrgA protein, partial [Myxococcaceae bacterium]|nr:FrgA protein [Myxococcaceae bacterium]
PTIAPPPVTPSGFPGVVVFPNPGTTPSPRSDPAAGAKQAPAPLAPAETGSAPVEWTLAQAREALKASTHDRDRIIRTALTFARRVFDFVAAFAIVRGTATGWAAEGDGAEAFQQRRPTIPLDTASVFRTVAMTRGSYVGPVPPDALTAHYLQQLGRSPRTLFLFPVEVKDRLVCLIYGDPGARPISQRRLSDLLLLCQDLPGAFGELILFRKQRYGASPRTALSFDEVVPETSSAGLGWGPSTPSAQNGIGRAAAAPMVIEDFGKTPADFAPILKKLTGPDATARAAAMAELARSPDASAKILAQQFPGPTAWSRLPVQELPDADELGPIPAALSRLGRSGAQALAPLLDADDPDVRYFALLTAGNLPYSELVGGVLRGIFDFEPDISSAARAAAAALRRVPRFVEAMKDLRQELADTDTLRRSLAARALGVLHDRESIEGLINLTGSDDALCAQAAAEALREITRANFGPDPRSWTAWWAENRTRSRAEWLVAALRHPDLEVRLSAIEELSKAINDNYGYFADAHPRDREGAIKKWEAALANNPRLRRLV